jgi:NAD-dependent deacetylase sirtuin 4
MIIQKKGVQELKELVKRAEGKLVVLTGAGVSTDSGVPDYRGPTGIYKRNKDYKPITYQQFMASEAFRKRYWGRSFLGWPKLQSALPNGTHLHLTELERRGLARPLMTQNVDGLHSKSGSSHVLELHGTLSKVQCQSCGFTESRETFQRILGDLNPELDEWGRLQRDQSGPDVASSVNPDGDFELRQASIINQVRIPPCTSCGGVLKPE